MINEVVWKKKMFIVFIDNNLTIERMDKLMGGRDIFVQKREKERVKRKKVYI